MALNGLGKMNWANLLNYTVQPADLELMHTYIAQHITSARGAQRSIGILSGGQITPVTGMGLKVAAGVGILPSGSLVTWPDLPFTIPAANTTNPRIDRIELLMTPTNNTAVLDVNSVSKTLDIINVVSVVVNSGTPAATPAAPIQTTGNLSLGLVTVGANVSTITAPNITQIPDAGLQVSAMTFGAGYLRFNPVTGAIQYSNNAGATWAPIGSGGGGGGSIRWNAPEGLAPVEQEENGDRVFLFDPGLGQKLVAFIKVPSSYIVGRPVNLNIAVYSPSATLTWALQATAYLIRKNLDAVSSVDNSNVVPTGDVTNTLANQSRALGFTLSSAGLVNGIGISPGDMLRVEIARTTASVPANDDTNEVRFIPNSTEVSFQ